jgi:CheY-like chemotaxis protein
MNDPNPSATRGSNRPRILLVEDNLAASRGLARLLEAQGHEVSIVSDGASALAALRHGPPPDFLLTDLQLPDFDGLEIARLARQLDPPPRVALITGWDIDGLQRVAERWGIEWVFSKPLDIQDLFAKLRQPARLERGTRQCG